VNVLLINPPLREDRHPAFPPLGLAIVANVLRNAGHQVELLDINSHRYSRGEMLFRLPDGPYDLVGVSGLITTYRYMIFLMPLLRQKYDAPIVIGGGGITSAPDVYMTNFRPEYGVIGEGEHTALELANGVPPKDILGLVYFEDGNLKINPPRPVEMDLDKFPWPAHDLLDHDIYLKHVSTGLMFATRGCPFGCKFCFHTFGRKRRQRSVKDVVDEMEYLAGIYDKIAFGDECLTTRKSYLLELCDEIIKRQLQIRWKCFTRADIIDEEMMAAMSMAGCVQVNVGFESGSQKILDAMGKGITVEQNYNFYATAKNYFSRVHASLIYGYPGETEETVQETVEFMKSINYYHEPAFLAPYPGTPVYKENKSKILAKFGTLHDFFVALGDAFDPVINLSDIPDEIYVRHRTHMMMTTWGHLCKMTLIHDLNENIIGVPTGRPIPREYIKDDMVYCLHPSWVKIRDKE